MIFLRDRPHLCIQDQWRTDSYLHFSLKSQDVHVFGQLTFDLALNLEAPTE